MRMYDIKATVTKATETDVKLAGNWPTDCLQAPRDLTPAGINELCSLGFHLRREFSK